MIMGLSIGMLLLSIYLILIGLSAFIPGLGKIGKITPILALAAGICILLGR